MTTDRCPGCHAAVTPGAPWCTLCYTDLRAPAPEPEPAPEPAPQYASAMAAGPHPAELLAPDPILDAPIAQQAPIARRELAGWPCSCGAIVPMADDACNQCGRPFLPSDATPSLALPVVGDITRLDRGQRIAVTAVVALVIMGAFVALAFIGGSIL